MVQLLICLMHSKLSLIKKGLTFDNCIAFMSDNTNVMKGARSGVQILIHNECPHLYDVRCSNINMVYMYLYSITLLNPGQLIFHKTIILKSAAS